MKPASSRPQPPTLDSIRQAGFTVDQLEHTVLPKVPKFVAPTILGAARFTPASAGLGRYPRRAVQLPPPAGNGGSPPG
jgi:hypothetical protein